MKKASRVSVVLAALLVAASTAQIHAAVLHVAPNGNDAWSGRLPDPAADRKDGPLATVPAAIEAMRRTRQSAPGEAHTIYLREGVYRLSAPIVLKPEDSGSSAAKPFAIAAWKNEAPRLSGGRAITGWKRNPSAPNQWQTEIPDVRDGKWYFRSLFIDGKRKQRARTPSTGFFQIQGESPQDKPVKLRYKAGDIKPEWAAAEDVEVVALLAWADFRYFIRSVDDANHVATLSGDPRPSNKENNARYYIENAPDGLNVPGEWYLNRKTGILYYLAHPDEDLAKVESVAGHIDDLLLFEGDFTAKKAVQHIALRGLTFEHTDWIMPPNGYADTQAAIATRGDIRGEGATDIVIEGCRFNQLAGYALEFGRGCQRIRIVGNSILDIGGGGVRLGETAKRSEPFEMNHSNVVTDNEMGGMGLVYPPAVGVFILQSGKNRIAHNNIHHLYYTAVSVGWNWGYQETPCRDNVIEFNHLHHVGNFMLSDMGAIYTLGIQKGTIIRNNLIHDVNAFTYGGWGLYPDEGSTEILLENNVVYRCKNAGFHQHYGRDNVVRNNIFVFGKENQVMRTRAEPHISFTFTNNIVYFDSGNLLGSNWSNDNYRMDHNVYFDARPGATADAMRFAGATLEDWRKRGHDVHSIIADPLFTDVASDDFSLKPNSPALKLGFKPINLETVGPREPGKRD